MSGEYRSGEYREEMLEYTKDRWAAEDIFDEIEDSLERALDKLEFITDPVEYGGDALSPGEMASYAVDAEKILRELRLKVR